MKDGGRYLGNLQVAEADQKVGTKLVLEPTRELDGAEGQRLKASKGPWSLYEIMPVDRHDAFLDLDGKPLTAEVLKTMLPADSLDEYLKDGKPAEPTDMQNSAGSHQGRQVRAGGVRLQALYKQYHLERALVADLCEAAERDLGYAEAARADAKEQEQFQEP